MLFICVWARHSYWTKNWRALLATACWSVEGYRTPDEANVCRGGRANCFEPEPSLGDRNRGKDGTAMMSRCLESVGKQSSLYRLALGPKRPSNERASPVRTVKLACAALAMVTFLSWTAIVRTSFFNARIPVWNRSRSTLRSVGSGNILHPVPCGQELCVVCQRVRRVHLVLLRGLWFVVLFGHSGCSLEFCVHGRYSFLLENPSCAGLGLRRCAYRWTCPLGGGRWEHYLRDPQGVRWFAQKCASRFQGNGSDSICVLPKMLGLRETAQSPWLLCMYGILD